MGTGFPTDSVRTRHMNGLATNFRQERTEGTVERTDYLMRNGYTYKLSLTYTLVII